MSEVNFIILPSDVPNRAFIEQAAAEFPAIADELLDEDYTQLLHLQVSALARYANACLKQQHLPEFARVVQFVEAALPTASSSLDNALHVSVIEHLELDGDSPTVQAARRLMPARQLQFYTEVQKWHQEAAQALSRLHKPAAP